MRWQEVATVKGKCVLAASAGPAEILSRDTTVDSFEKVALQFRQFLREPER